LYLIVPSDVGEASGGRGHFQADAPASLKGDRWASRSIKSLSYPSAQYFVPGCTDVCVEVLRPDGTRERLDEKKRLNAW